MTYADSQADRAQRVRRVKRYLVVVGGLLAYSTARGIMNERAAEKTFGQLGVACDGRVVPSAASAEPGASHGVAFEQERANGWHLARMGLPGDVAAKGADDVAYVVCLDPVRDRVVERCRFRKGIAVRMVGVKVAGIPTGETVVYRRVQHERPLRVVAPSSGRVIAEGVVAGSVPAACDRYVGQPSDEAFAGAGPNAMAVANWLAQNLPKR
jgi:hypothetical protein